MKKLRRTPEIKKRAPARKAAPQRLKWLRTAGLLTLLLLAALSMACRRGQDSWQAIQERGVLRVGLDPTYPPFAVADASGVYGLDIDLANAIAADLGLKTQFVLFGYDGLYDALATQQVDVLISALIIAPERTRDFAYSHPYFNAGELLIVPATNTHIAQMADMNGRTLAVETGALGHVEAIAWGKRLANLAVLPYPTADEALTAVAAGAADAALIDAVSGRLYLKTTPGLKRTSQPVTVEPFAVVVRIDDQRLLAAVNGALNRLQQAGTLEQMIGQWLGE